MIKKWIAIIFGKLILLNFKQISTDDFVSYAWQWLVGLSGIGFVFKGVGIWFFDNKQFISFLLYALMVNAALGVWRHFQKGSFDWVRFFKKTGVMLLILMAVYPILEMVGIILGENFASDSFRVVIQIATFLYPGSKIMKNAYILSGGKFPPKFIMTNLYKFEKTGNINDINNTKQND